MRFPKLREALLDLDRAVDGMSAALEAVSAVVDEIDAVERATSAIKTIPPQGPTPVDEGAFKNPIADPELPEGARLYETAPGQFQGIGPKGEQFVGARDSVIAALKGIAS